MSGVTLKRNGNLLVLEVPGVGEGRPRLVPGRNEHEIQINMLFDFIFTTMQTILFIHLCKEVFQYLSTKLLIQARGQGTQGHYVSVSEWLLPEAALHVSVLTDVSILWDFSFTMISGPFSKSKLQCSNSLKSNRCRKKAGKAAKIKFRISI